MRPSPTSSSGVRPAERRENRGSSPAKTRTLQVRLALLVVAITSPVLLLVGFLSLYAADRAVNEELSERGLRAADWIDDTFGPMNLRDQAGLQREIERFTRVRSGVSELVIFARDEDTGGLTSVAANAPVVAVAPSANDWLAAQGDKTVLRRGEGVWDVAAPLHDKKRKVVGVAHAEVRLRERADEIVADARLYIPLVALAALGLSGLALVFALERAIGQRVESLVAVMERARQGDLDAQVEVPVLDEFGWLGENFNRMLRRLKENDQSLRRLMEQAARFNEELKKQVALATEELARKNDELARANHRLFEAQRALGNSERLASLGQLASQMAHEIGTPLNSIYGHIQLLAADEISDGARARVSIVESQVERLTKIIENVLRTLRLPDAQLREIDVNPVVAGIAAFMQPVAENRRIRLELALPEGLPPVYADPRQLEQVLLNLFTNALDAMPDGGTLCLEASLARVPGEPRPDSVSVSSSASGERPAIPAEDSEHVLIKVRDTGIGIARENIHRIFEPFFTTKAPGSGTGLGLPICKQIVRAFRGSLSAESAGAGQGACFTVTLPAIRRSAFAALDPVPAVGETLTTDSSATTVDIPGDAPGLTAPTGSSATPS